MNFSSPKIMGILNVTPDSFSGDGIYSDQNLSNLGGGISPLTVEIEKMTVEIEKMTVEIEKMTVEIEKKMLEMIKDGADIIDVGAESTGPGSIDISAEDELNRLKKVIEVISENHLNKKVLFSVDTYKSEVAEYALEHGFGMVNDVTALRGDEFMMGVLLKYQPYVVLMYSKDDTARTTSEVVEYDDVIDTITDFLTERIQILLDAGFPKEKIIIDPGMGAFVSSNPKYSFEIIERLSELKELGYPILIGISRKSCLGGKLEDRDQPSVDWSLKAIKNGADIIRIHNVELMKNNLESSS